MENEINLGSILLTSITAMFFLALLILTIYNVYRKRILEKEAELRIIEKEKQVELFKAAAEAEEGQKEKIAKNLHDGVIPGITACQRSILKNIKDYEKNQTLDLIRVKKDMQSLNEIVDNIRNVSHDLIPGTLLSFGLIKALSYYLDQIKDTGDSKADFENLSVFDEEIPFSKTDQLHIYRICLEILNNLYKHAHYKYLKVTTECNNNIFEIEFMHDGKGITNQEIDVLSESAKGLGLKSLKSRIMLLNASINYYIDSDNASVKVTIPLKK